VITPENYLKLKKQVEELDREAVRARAELDLLMKRVKEEFDCDSLEAAKDKLKELEAEEVEINRRFGDKLKEVTSTWTDIFNGDDEEG
jgi:hypothetical protein